MFNILLIIYTIVVVIVIVFVLLQKSERGALGLGEPGQAVGSVRRKPDALVRVTQIFGAMFLTLSLVLSLLSNRGTETTSSIVQEIEAQSLTDPAPQPSDTGESLPTPVPPTE